MSGDPDLAPVLIETIRQRFRHRADILELIDTALAWMSEDEFVARFMTLVAQPSRTDETRPIDGSVGRRHSPDH